MTFLQVVYAVLILANVFTATANFVIGNFGSTLLGLLIVAFLFVFYPTKKVL